MVTIDKADAVHHHVGHRGQRRDRVTRRASPRRASATTDGKAITFGFKNSAGDYVSWILYGAKGVADEVPDATMQKILSTVRLYGEPTGG